MRWFPPFLYTLWFITSKNQQPLIFPQCFFFTKNLYQRLLFSCYLFNILWFYGWPTSLMYRWFVYCRSFSAASSPNIYSAFSLIIGWGVFDPGPLITILTFYINITRFSVHHSYQDNTSVVWCRLLRVSWVHNYFSSVVTDLLDFQDTFLWYCSGPCCCHAGHFSPCLLGVSSYVGGSLSSSLIF